MHDLHVNMETLQQDNDLLQQDNNNLRSRCGWVGGREGLIKGGVDYVLIFTRTHTLTERARANVVLECS